MRQLAADDHGISLLVHHDGQPLVARLVAENYPPALVDQEVAVSDAVTSGPDSLRAHVGAIVDLGTTPEGGLILLSEYVDGPRLDVLLQERCGDLTIGEAVTLLAPLATAIDEGHRIGVTGLVRGVTSVRLRRSGAPVMVGLRDARVGSAVPERFRHRDPSYAVDRERWQRIGTAVAEALPAPDRAALRALLERHTGGLDFALFELAEPLPVRFVRVAPEASSLAGGVAPTTLADTHSTPVTPATPRDRSHSLGDRVDAVLSTVHSLGLPTWVADAVESTVQSIARRAAEVVALRHRLFPTAGAAVRSRFRVIGVAGAAALVGTIIMASLPSDDQGDALPAPTMSTFDPPGREDPSGDVPVSLADLPETVLHPEPDDWLGIVDELVDRWLACGPAAAGGDDRGSGGESPTAPPACRAGVVHAGSAAERLITVADDRHRVLSEWSGTMGDIVVVERMGSAVLIDLLTTEATTASLLIVRSEAGWRIRDVIG